MSSISSDGKSFNITIYQRIKELGRVRNITWTERYDALIHEWAHCLAWNANHQTLEFHDAMWGVAYANAYNAIYAD